MECDQLHVWQGRRRVEGCCHCRTCRRGTAVAALAGVGKSALDAYATYEQAVGGVDTLFKDASGTVQKYAAEAYKNAGVSANEYMTQVTSFSASLISSLGGDTAKAAELGNTAMIDMSDNANKMGTDIESIQQTYQSLARGNYAMLDNLKLGYGGTKSEMERLIQDANKVKQANGEMGDLSIDKFSDVVQAIHIMQEQMGISGTTAKEAATTIEGSVGMMKAAWQNWLAELGKDNADIKGLTTQLVDSIGTVIQNVGPRIAQIITGITAALPQLFSSLGSTLPALVMQILPPVLGALGQLGTMLLTSATTWITTSLPQLLAQFQSWVTSSLPSFLQTGLTMITNLLQGIVQALPQIASTAVIVLTTLLDGLSAQLPQLIPIGINAVLNLVARHPQQPAADHRQWFEAYPRTGSGPHQRHAGLGRQGSDPYRPACRWHHQSSPADSAGWRTAARRTGQWLRSVGAEAYRLNSRHGRPDHARFHIC